jgi:hypothetical protein
MEVCGVEALAMAAATALVGAMATDAWQKARSAVLALWRRVHPDRVATLEEQLSEARSDVLAGDSKVAEEVALAWKRQLLHLLNDDPFLEGELQRVLDDELTPLLSPALQRRIQNISMTATASGQAQVFQAGRDIQINRRP